VQVNISEMSLDRLRRAIRTNRVAFPSQVPIFPRQPRPNIQWRLVELFFIHNWSCADLAPRYGLSAGHVSHLISRWVRRAAALGYLQEIPPMEALAEEGRVDRRARGRAAPAQAQPPVLHWSRLAFGKAVIDLRAHTITAAGRPVELTPTEWAILENLASQVNRTVPRYELVKLLRDDELRRSVHSLRHFIRNLRQKLEPNPANPRYLITEPTIGYRLDVPRTVLTRRHNRRRG
jgi:DNA-binding winged helix-turn-helix (wHTH) protein